MHIHITPRHIKLTAAIHSYIAEKIGHAEDISPEIMAAHVVIWHDETRAANRRHVVKAHLSVPGPDIFSEDHGADLYAVIDAVAEHLLQQLRKRKTKLKGHQRHLAKRAKERQRSTGRSRV